VSPINPLVYFIYTVKGYFLMKSYIKLFGPPIMKAITELEKIAIDMPQVCVMEAMISTEIPKNIAEDIGGHAERWGNVASTYYLRNTGVRVPVERCRDIISRLGESLGEYDFFFEWFQKPSVNQVEDLISKIDEVLLPLGVKYTITTK
jgi:hypothetical protein